MWVFDHQDGSARLLRQRQGHKAPPSQITYYGSSTSASLADGSDGTSLQILSAGTDRQLRLVHAVRDQQNVEFSQKPLMRRTGGNGKGGKKTKYDHAGALGMATG